mgnify:CR=1 FL=1
MFGLNKFGDGICSRSKYLFAVFYSIWNVCD